VADINGPLTRGGPTTQSQKPFNLKKVPRYDLKKCFIIGCVFSNGSRQHSSMVVGGCLGRGGGLPVICNLLWIRGEKKLKNLALKKIV
jgi:hypothetical protein